MPVQGKYDDETRARAVRLYVERRKSDPAESQVASRRHVGGLIGVGPETLRGWVERDERNAGARPSLSDEASAEVRQLRKENAELKRANVILRTASAFGIVTGWFDSYHSACLTGSVQGSELVLKKASKEWSDSRYSFGILYPLPDLQLTGVESVWTGLSLAESNDEWHGIDTELKDLGEVIEYCNQVGWNNEV